MGWFTPYWKKEDFVAAAMAVRLERELPGRLKKIVQEAPNEDTKAAAVIVLGRKGACGEKTLRKIIKTQSSGRIMALAKQQLSIRGKIDRDRRDTAMGNIMYDMRYNGLRPHDVTDSIPNVADRMYRAVMMSAVLQYCEEPDHETKTRMHRLIAELMSFDEAGTALSYFLSSLPVKLVHEITKEESDQLRDIYDGDQSAKEELVLYFDPDDRGYVRLPHAYSPNPYHTLIRIWTQYENDPLLRRIADLDPMLRNYNYHADVRSAEAAGIDTEARELLDTLGIQAADIPDEVLLKAMEFHLTLPLKFLHEHGKKEFIEKHFARKTMTTYKSFDPEDDRFYTEEQVTVLYGDPNDESDMPVPL